MLKPILPILVLVLWPACSDAPGRSGAAASVAPSRTGTFELDATRCSRRDEAGWIFVHLEGTPREIGLAHGRLLAAEIDDALRMFRAYVPEAAKRDWNFFRKTGEDLFWPRLDEEQRAEINGIAEGARSQGREVDRWDVVALNGWIEIAWYLIPQLDKRADAAPGNCSAFVATGSWTTDGGIVMGHNAWVDYAVVARWNVVADILPEHGHRMLMDTFPGFIHSGDDFTVNDAGLMVTETTISQFEGFDPAGVPEFSRARRSVQYASTIDEWAAIMRAGNNGAYANSWLAGDRKTGEIARLELGLRNMPLERTKDGFFIGSNFPSDPKLRAEETTFKAGDPDSSPNVRRCRWEALMKEWRGRIDAGAGKRFLSDHVDPRTGETKPSARTLCGHCELDPMGTLEWSWPAFYPGGAGQSKVTDSTLAARLSFWACMGHACGTDFKAAPFLGAHPEFASQKPYLKDLPAGQWTLFAAVQP